MSKTILITGASSGFGRDTAETLARAGHRVFASMRDVAGRNRQHAEALRKKGIQVLEIDVTNDASVENGVNAVLAETQRLDVLINNAGIGSAGVSEAFTTAQPQELFDVNVFGVQRMLRAVLPTLRGQGDGLVVNVGSILGRVTFPFFGLYGASKFALEVLTDSYRYELSALGVDVVLVQPSNYPTGIFASAQRPDDAERIGQYGEVGHIPEKMVGTLVELFQSENAPDPHDVAVAIEAVVGQSRGTRASRVVVGQSFGADALNDQASAVQAQLLEGMGLPTRIAEMSDDGAAASGVHPLDNLVWGALNGVHGRFSIGGDRARRYLTEVAPFAAMADLGAESTAALRELTAAHGPAAMSTVDALPELPGLLPVSQVRLIQMVWQSELVPAPGLGHVRLRERDVPAMMALALETRPGPFGPRTSELGEYLGIFDENKLVAMAGERMKVDGYTEISAVCVSEGFRGRGYAAQLTTALVSAVRSRGETPLLHVLASNHRAIALYRRLGFVERREMYLTVLDAVH